MSHNQKKTLFDIDFQVCIIGDGGVGKTSTTLRFICGSFTDNYIPTIEDSFEKTIHVNGKTITLGIIDTAGQDEFSSMKYRYQGICDGFIFVYAVDDPNSLQSILNFYDDCCQSKNTDRICCIIAANKDDLSQDKHIVSLSEAQETLKKLKVQIIQTSAKTGMNIDLLYSTIAKMLINRTHDVGCKISCCIQ
jgi:small GTP-binding protein